MKILINNNPVKLKPANDLTCKEYIDILNYKNISIIEYIAYFSGYTPEQVKHSKIKTKDLNKIAYLVGQLQNLESFFEIKQIPENISICGKKYEYKNLIDLCESVGARILYTEFEKNKQKVDFENIIYLLAIVLDGSLDNESTNRTYENLLKENYTDCFPYAAFFLAEFQKTSSKELNFFKKLKKITRIQTKTIG